MAIKETIAAIGTTEKVTAALLKWIAGNRGFKNTVTVELKENIELIRLYIDTGANPKQLALNLKEDAYRHALAEGFNFNSLNSKKITIDRAIISSQLNQYQGWETQQLFENIYSKVAIVKQAANIENAKKPIRLGVRLTNIFKLMVLLASHIGK
ncbi:hypothetical protein HII17_10440 [Thalassotalea sp. M1531]|uniref:Uncharacterized protein n=1 Tax=Thalassotalea algicola TaxID=2716224 RepID=A0A7Y0Q8C2_9GAMM|nr:hypothetical protein [Thalassotalea algicola]NMP31985.1 hypothetical protein [Thalassotalea algicola]